MTDQFTLRKLKEQCENVFQAFFKIRNDGGGTFLFEPSLKPR